MKMFGDMTRIKYQWYPSNELCKRFNVQNPFPDSSIVGVPELQKRATKNSADSMDITILGSSSAIGLPNTANELNTRKEINKLKTKEDEDIEFFKWDDDKPQNDEVIF